MESLDNLFGEKEVVAIGEHVTRLLREWTKDVRKALVDSRDDEGGVAKPVKIGMNITLEEMGGKVFPEIKLKFATGKKIADTAKVEVDQAAIPGT